MAFAIYSTLCGALSATDSGTKPTPNRSGLLAEPDLIRIIKKVLSKARCHLKARCLLRKVNSMQKIVTPIALFALFLTGIASTSLAQRKAVVELEVHVATSNTGDRQTWGELLSKVGADRYSIKSSRSRIKMEVAEDEIRGQKFYRIVGVLSRNKLQLPGGVSFGTRDQASIAAYVKRIRDDGPKTALAKKLAFGLTAEQLVDLHTDLAAKHGKSTKSKKTMDIVEAIADKIKTPMRVDASAREALAGKTLIKEELKSLSCGTTLAAILRPLGLVAQPQRQQGKKLEIIITSSRNAKEHWPIGWPNEKSNLSVAPKMFEKKDYEIANFELQPVLDVMEKRTKVPFLYDQNSMARHGADTSKSKVTIVKKQQTYFSVVRQALAQSSPRLKFEIRIDEAGNPFLWITTTK